MKKNFYILSLCLTMVMISPVSALANVDKSQNAETELTQLLAVDESQFHLSTRGQATLIVPGDPLLDGDYKNGELVNGSIYYSAPEALAGVKKDKAEAQTRVYPSTGNIEGPDSGGAFEYTIHSSGRTYSFNAPGATTWVDTESDIYRDLEGGSYLESEDYSYIVTLMDNKGNAKGSFKAYPNKISGGVNFNTTKGTSYYLKLAANSFPRNWYLHGSGNVEQ